MLVISSFSMALYDSAFLFSIHLVKVVYINVVSVCVPVCLFAIGVYYSGPNSTRVGVWGGALTSWEGHE